MDTLSTTNNTTIQVQELTKVYLFGEVEVHALRASPYRFSGGNSWPSWDPPAPANQP